MAAGPAVGKKALRMLALAPLDYLFVGPRRFAIQVLYYFEPHLDFARLQSGLRTVAEAFYPINSHLVRHRDEYYIGECADDPDFAEIICDAQTMPPDQDRPETFCSVPGAIRSAAAGGEVGKIPVVPIGRWQPAKR